MIPMLTEIGDEMIRHFELDAARLRVLINDGAPANQRIDDADIALLAMSASGASYVSLQLEETLGADTPLEGMRSYLIDKYVHKPRAVASHDSHAQASAAAM
jgi:hypothetical protein